MPVILQSKVLPLAKQQCADNNAVLALGVHAPPGKPSNCQLTGAGGLGATGNALPTPAVSDGTVDPKQSPHHQLSVMQVEK